MPKRLATIRAGLAAGASDEAHHSFAARLLGWIEGQPAQITAAGQRLLDAAPDSDDESAAFALALLEQAPLCTITSELLLGEWLELRELAPALVRVCGMSEARARWLVPGLLAWRDELRTRGWVARRVAEHLRGRTKWMEGLSTRGRDVLGKLGVVTREGIVALDLAALRGSNRCRPDTVDEIQRFRLQLARPVVPPRSMERRVVPRIEPAPVEPSVDVRAAAGRLLARHGCTSIAALARETKLDVAALRDVLDELAEIDWLDEDTGWFWSPTRANNPLVERVHEVLADAGEIDVIDLRSALARRGDAPPPPVLAALCEQLEEIELLDDGTRVRLAGDDEPVIDGDTTVAELAAVAGLTVEQVVALALGEPTPARRRGGSKSSTRA